MVLEKSANARVSIESISTGMLIIEPVDGLSSSIVGQVARNEKSTW